MKETAPSPMPNPALQATLRIKPRKAPELERLATSQYRLLEECR